IAAGDEKARIAAAELVVHVPFALDAVLEAVPEVPFDGGLFGFIEPTLEAVPQAIAAFDDFGEVMAMAVISDVPPQIESCGGDHRIAAHESAVVLPLECEGVGESGIEGLSACQVSGVVPPELVVMSAIPLAAGFYFQRAVGTIVAIADVFATDE